MSIIGWASDSVCPNKMSRRGHNWWPRGWRGRGERRPLEPSTWRTSMGAMATALMRRWFRGVGLADGRESRTQTCGEAGRKKWHGGLLFKYHLVFITQTYTRALAACPQLHRFLCTLVFLFTGSPRLRRRLPSWDEPGVLDHSRGGSRETHFGHRWLNHRALWLLGG